MSDVSQHPNKTREPTRDDVYEDNRDGLQRVMYASDSVVLFKCKQLSRNGERHIHNFIGRNTFDKQVAANRLEYKPDVECSIPKADPNVGEEYESAESTQESLDNNETAKTDDKQASLESATSDSSTKKTTSPSKTESGDVVKKDWSEVDMISEETAANLHQQGFLTEIDIRGAETNDLKEVENVGAKSVKNLREWVEIEWINVSGVGPSTHEALHENGYDTKKSVLTSSIEELKEVDGIGEKTAGRLQEYAETL